MWNLFFRNRRLLVLGIGLVAVSGLSALVVLPRMEDPLLTRRFAAVHTQFPGASAERVESLVTEKIEDALRELDEIKELRSISRAGISTINIELRDDIYETETIWSEVRDKLDDAAREMPSEADEPFFEELDVKAYALIVALTWERTDPPNYAILRRLGRELEDQLNALPATEKVERFGEPEEEVVVQVRSADLAARDLTASEVARRIRESDAKVPAGLLRSDQSDLLVEVEGELDSLSRIAATSIRFGSNGQVTRVGDVASVRKGIRQPPSSLAFVSGKPALVMGVFVRDDTRLDWWDEGAQATCESFRQQLPAGVALQTVFRQNRYVSDRLATLTGNLAMGAAAVSVVVLFMMGWRSALVVVASLPLSALMVVAGLRFLNVPIHQMSITGLILALGLLIDNAIVIVDEVQTRLRAGVDRALAVAESVRHLAIPLFGSTLTTALAFAPLVMMEGPAGEFVGSIAVSVVLAIGGSYLLAMTAIPALAAMTRSGDSQEVSQSSRWWNHGVANAALSSGYRATLTRVFRWPVIGLIAGTLLPVGGFIQARNLTEQFFPPADRDQCQIEFELPAYSSLQATISTVHEVRAALLRHPEVQDVHWFLGESAPTFYYNVIPRRRNTSSYAQALVQLKNAEGSRDVIRELQDWVDHRFPAARLLVRQLEQGPPFDAPIEARIFGPDVAELRRLGRELRSVLVNTAGVLHTRADLAELLPKVTLDVDEEQARLVGLSHTGVARQLNEFLEGAVGGSVLEVTEELPVRVRLADDRRDAIDEVLSLDLRAIGQLGSAASVSNSGDGRSTPSDLRRFGGIPVAALARVGLQPDTAAIPRLDGRRMNEVQAFLPAGVLPATVLNRFRARLESTNFELPEGYELRFGGEAAKRNDAVGNLLANVGILAVAMVATLVLSFGSFRMATIIGAVAALSIGLGCGALWLFGYPFGFMAIVGTMGLVGVAINDTIVVLAAIQGNPAARLGDPAAVADVVLESTRHVVATSLTTMAGFAPLVMDGGDFWPPVAVAIAGGVAGATILALYFAPAAYLILMRAKKGGQAAAV